MELLPLASVEASTLWFGASALLFLEATSLLLRKTLFKLSATSKDRLYCCQFERRSQSCGETICFIQFWTALSIEKVFVYFLFFCGVIVSTVDNV